MTVHAPRPGRHPSPFVSCARVLDSGACLVDHARVLRHSIRALVLLVLALVLLVLALAGCDSCVRARPPVPAPPALQLEAPRPSPVPPPAPAAVLAPYEVHEWGLVGVDARPGAPAGPATVAAVPWGRAPQPGGHADARNVDFPPSGVGLGKPVLYVHLLDATQEVTFSARVTLPRMGTIAEHWPERTLDAPGVVTWSGVRAHRGECRPRAYPSSTEFPCLGRDGCEAEQLAKYETSDGACLTAAGRDYDDLFYRGELPTFEAPLVLARGTDGAVLARNPTDELIGPFVVRVVVRGGQLSVLVSDAVGEGGEVSIPSPTATPTPPSVTRGAAARGAGIRALVAGLRAAGLSEPESEAFGRAWWDELFATASRTETGRRGYVAARPAPSVPRDELLYWLPQGLADRASVLTFDPPPRAVRRALLVRQAL